MKLPQQITITMQVRQLFIDSHLPADQFEQLMMTILKQLRVDYNWLKRVTMAEEEKQA